MKHRPSRLPSCPSMAVPPSYQRETRLGSRRVPGRICRMVDVEPLRPDDWKTTRDLRLRALLDAPEAFGGTYADSAARDEASWRAWPRNGQPFAAYRDGEPVGMVCAWLDP